MTDTVIECLIERIKYLRSQKPELSHEDAAKIIIGHALDKSCDAFGIDRFEFIKIIHDGYQEHKKKILEATK